MNEAAEEKNRQFKRPALPIFFNVMGSLTLVGAVLCVGVGIASDAPDAGQAIVAGVSGFVGALIFFGFAGVIDYLAIIAYNSGAEVSPKPAPAVTVPVPFGAPKKGIINLIVLGGLVIAVVVAVIFVFLFSKPEQPPVATAPSAASAATHTPQATIAVDSTASPATPAVDRIAEIDRLLAEPPIGTPQDADRRAALRAKREAIAGPSN